jgi:hypothetical protein
MITGLKKSSMAEQTECRTVLGAMK